MNTTGYKRGDRVRFVDSVDLEYDTYLGLQIGVTEGMVVDFSYMTDDIIMISILWNNPCIEVPHWPYELQVIAASEQIELPLSE